MILQLAALMHNLILDVSNLSEAMGKLTSIRLYKRFLQQVVRTSRR